MTPASGIETTLRALLRSTNPQATEVLLTALDASHRALSVGAVRALAKREDLEGHRGLIERYARLPPEVQAALGDVPLSAPLAGALPALISPRTPDLTRRAAELAEAWGTTDPLAAIARAARAPDAPHGSALAAIALRMARRLAQQVDLYRQAHSTDRPERDPAFARRAAINELGSALRIFDQHRQTDLIKAFVALTPGDEPVLLGVMADPAHVGHEVLRATLATSDDANALAVLGWAMTDLRSPQALVKVAGEHVDATALTAMFARLNDPIGVASREACSRIDSLGWLEESRLDVLQALNERAQSIAIQVAAASSADRAQLALAIEELIRTGQPAGRRAACRAIAELPPHLAVGPLSEALRSDDSRALIAATKLLRRMEYPHATQKLIGLLDHSDPGVRSAAQRSLEGLSFGAFRDHLNELPEEKRAEVGRLVGKADPFTAPTLRSELLSGAANRRMKALELIDLMEVRLELLDELVQAAGDSDAGVRVEAIRLLAQGEADPNVVAVLTDALKDRSRPIQEAARQALDKLGIAPSTVAAGE